MSRSEYLLLSYGQFENMTFFPPTPTFGNCKNSKLETGNLNSHSLLLFLLAMWCMQYMSNRTSGDIGRSLHLDPSSILACRGVWMPWGYWWAQHSCWRCIVCFGGKWVHYFGSFAFCCRCCMPWNRTLHRRCWEMDNWYWGKLCLRSNMCRGKDPPQHTASLSSWRLLTCAFVCICRIIGVNCSKWRGWVPLKLVQVELGIPPTS